MKQILLIALFVGFSYVLNGQVSQPTTLTELFNKSTTYPGLQAKSAEIEVAGYGIQITRRQNLPQLQMQAQNNYGTYNGVAGALFALPGSFNISGLGAEGEAVDALVSGVAKWDVIQFGKHKDQVKMARIEHSKAELNFTLEDLDVKHQLTQSYFYWNFSRYMEVWADKEIKRDSTLFRLSKTRVNSGLASAADSLLVKSSLKQARAQKRKWQAEVQKSENRIFELTGEKISQKSPSQAFYSQLEEEFLEEEELHPLLALKEEERKRLNVKYDHLHHQLLPTISAMAGGMFRGVGYETESGTWSDPYKLATGNYLVGFGLTWNLDRLYKIGPKANKNKQMQLAAKRENEVVELHLQEQQNSLSFQLHKSSEEIEDSEAAYETAKESYRLFRIRYESGVIDLTTLMQIQQTLLFTESARIKAYYQYWQYWNQLAYIQGDYSLLINLF